MPNEVAVNVPFDSSEIVEIAKQEFEKRLRGLSPLQGEKQYAAFSLDFQVKIHLRRSGEQVGTETLAWGNAARPSKSDVESQADETAEEVSRYDSKDPNEERVDRDMPLTVETTDGRGGRTRRKVRVKV